MKKKIEILGRKIPVLAVIIAVLAIGTASAAVFTHYATMQGDVIINSPITVSVDGEPFYLGENRTLDAEIVSYPCTINETLEFTNTHGSPINVSLFWILYDSSETWPFTSTETYYIYNTTILSVPTEGLTYTAELDIPSYMIGSHKFYIEVNPVF